MLQVIQLKSDTIQIAMLIAVAIVKTPLKNMINYFAFLGMGNVLSSCLRIYPRAYQQANPGNKQKKLVVFHYQVIECQIKATFWPATMAKLF